MNGVSFPLSTSYLQSKLKLFELAHEELQGLKQTKCLNGVCQKFSSKVLL